MSTQTKTKMFEGVSFETLAPWQAYWLVMLRFVAGWWLLHAGLDKLVNWPFDASWFVGGAAAGTSIGPFVTMFSGEAGMAFVNVMVPVGQFLIGLGLIVGGLTRTAAFFGALLMTFFYFINGETGGWAHGVVTGELLGIMIFGTIVALGAGKTLAVDEYLKKTSLFENNPRLKKLLG